MQKPKETVDRNQMMHVVQRLLVMAVAVAGLTPAALAESPEAFTLQGEAHDIELVAVGATRRAILERVLAESGVAVEWRDNSYAEEKIDARYRGSFDQIASWLLARANFVIAYRKNGDAQRMVQIIVLGRGALAPRALALPPRPGARRPVRTAAHLPENGRAAEKTNRQQELREQALQRMQAHASAVRKRREQLGWTMPLLRTQAVTRVPPKPASAQAGSIPVVPMPRR
jgi:hypothetical protein